MFGVIVITSELPCTEAIATTVTFTVLLNIIGHGKPLAASGWKAPPDGFAP